MRSRVNYEHSYEVDSAFYPLSVHVPLESRAEMSSTVDELNEARQQAQDILRQFNAKRSAIKKLHETTQFERGRSFTESPGLVRMHRLDLSGGC